MGYVISSAGGRDPLNVSGDEVTRDGAEIELYTNNACWGSELEPECNSVHTKLMQHCTQITRTFQCSRTTAKAGLALA